MHAAVEDVAGEGQDVERPFVLPEDVPRRQVRGLHHVHVVVGERADHAQDRTVPDVVLLHDLAQGKQHVIAGVQAGEDQAADLSGLGDHFGSFRNG